MLQKVLTNLNTLYNYFNNPKLFSDLYLAKYFQCIEYIMYRILKIYEYNINNLNINKYINLNIRVAAKLKR